MVQERLNSQENNQEQQLPYVAPKLEKPVTDDKIRIIYGPNEQYQKVTGKTVGQVKSKLRDIFHMPKDAAALINNKIVDDSYVLSSGDTLEFFKSSGVKGTLTKYDLVVRWARTADIEIIKEIEESCKDFEGYDAWDEKEINKYMKDVNNIILVVETKDECVGYIFYSLEENFFIISKIAIDPKYHRTKIGQFLIDRLKSKLGNRRKGIKFYIPENNLLAQVFMRANQFIATEIVGVDEQVYYLMEYFY